MRGQLTIARQGLIVVCVLLIFELFFIATVAGALNETRNSLAKERKTIEIVSGISRVATLLQRAGTGMAREAAPDKLREMISNKSEDPTSHVREVTRTVDELKHLVEHDGKTIEGLQELEDINNEGVRYFREQKDVFREEGTEKLFAAKMLGFANRSRIIADQLVARYKPAETVQENRTIESMEKIKHMLIAGMAWNLAAVLVLALLFVSRVSKRLAVIKDNMRRFRQRKPLHDMLAAGDEIADLDRLFHQMVESLNEATRREQDLIDGSYDVISSIDATGIITNINAACLRQWGFEKQELIGEHFSKVVREKYCEELTRHLESSKHKASAVTLEVTIRRKDETTLKTNWSCQWSSEEQVAFCFISDISEEKSMETLLTVKEEQVRSLMRNVPVGVLVTDEQGIVKSANQKMEALLACQRGNILQKPLSAFFDAKELATKSSITEMAVAGSPLICKARRGKDDQFHSEITMKRIADSDDTLVVVEDATERVRLEAMKSNFISLLGRSLRNPLDEMNNKIESHAKEVENEKLRTRLERVCSNIDRLLKLIAELLDIEKLGPGRIVGELKPVSISDIVYPAVDFIGGYAEKQGIPLKVESTDSIVMADSERLVQVVVNLISNAIKFSPAGREIRVQTREDGSFVEVSITDGGKGVPLEMQEAIFRPYVQASSDDSKKGTGLGLPICKAIVESHKGTIGVTSKDGQGSEFWFRIPRQSDS